jgi:hypothetical protein
LTGTFADNPATYFANDSRRAHALPRAEAEALQLEALRARFAALRDKLPPLDALAAAQDVTEIASLDAAAVLLFPHGFFKSYPEQLLIEGAYAPMTDWLSRLTACDVSAVQDRNFASMDDWLDALDAQTPLEMYHSSGTTGRLSFYPRGKAEVAVALDQGRMCLPEWFDPPKFKHGDWTFTFIWPSHASGRSAILRAGQIYRQLLTEREEDFHPLLPTVLSADYHYHVMRTTNMAAQGQIFGPVASDYVRSRLDEADALKAFVPERTEQLLDVIAERRNNGRIMIAGGPVNIHALAAAGLVRGMTDAAMPGSIIRTFGGLKNHPGISTLEADVMRFIGSPDLLNAFGMTELTSGFSMCRAGRYHIAPWVIPFVFDPKSGALLPRDGVQRGRSGFFDLIPQSYWGGVLTADSVEISWDPCACGRASAHMGSAIGRIAENAGGDRALGPAPPGAMGAALEALMEGLPQPH